MMRQVVLARYAKGQPKPEDFRVETAPIPVARDGEILLKTYWLSLDPLIRFAIDETLITGRAKVNIGDVLYGGAVSRVEASNVEGFAPGEWVEGRTGWREYAAIDPAKTPVRKVDPAKAPLPAYLGVLGMPGQTAHAAMIEVGRVQAGETVVISAAAGAVGSMAGQIGKLLGARVIGIAGGPDKGRAVEALGFDRCLDYKAPDFAAQLGQACPGGIDVYIDNVGGEVTQAVLPHFKYGGRMIVCGFIAYYGMGMEGPGPDRLPGFMRMIMSKGLEIRGFGGILAAGKNALDDMARWLAEDRLKLTQTVVEGLDSAPEAFAGIFGGNKNVGKLVVRVGQD